MRNLCIKCPYYYSDQSYCGEYDWGCRVFGDECAKCPSFWDDEGDADESEMGCNVHPKKLAFLLHRQDKKFQAWCERSLKEEKLKKFHSMLPKEDCGYKAYDKKGVWMRIWTDDYRPNMKGGHRHNHLSNHELRLMHTKNERKCIRKFLKKDSL